jgi:glycosyltransferase involved in cell wall biosynthesis
MRILIPEYSNRGGIETVNLEVIPELITLVDRVVWVMPEHRLEYFQSYLPASDRLVYESLLWPEQSWYKAVRRLDGLLSRLGSYFPEKSFLQLAAYRLRQYLSSTRLQTIISTHQITHCLCTWIFNTPVPPVKVPIGAMVMDLNWHYFPENFQESREVLDEQLLSWLNQAEIIFPVSYFTEKQVKESFPTYRALTQVVPHGAKAKKESVPQSMPQNDLLPDLLPSFYYPASVFKHKSHLELLHVANELIQKGYLFHLILTGARTDKITSNSPQDNPYIEECRRFYQENYERLSLCIKAVGFCSREEVENFYHSCLGVVLPTQYEGFGLPLLEALERGVYVICTDIPPFVEQIDRYDCAQYVDVYPVGDLETLQNLMVKVLDHYQQTQERPLGAPPETMERWTWRDAAVAYVNGLASVSPSSF